MSGYYSGVRLARARKHQSNKPSLEEPCALYRHFDAAGALLYVGIAVDPCNRLMNHMSRSRWRGLIATVTIERFATRRDALAAEAAAIKIEKPLHNVAHIVDGQNLGRDRLRIERLLAFDLAELDGHSHPTAEDWAAALTSAPSWAARLDMVAKLKAGSKWAT